MEDIFYVINSFCHDR